MAGIQRVFLDWSQPALPNAADWLLARAPTPGDLADFVTVVPGGRAGRRLLEILVQKCADNDVGLSPPKTVTMGALPELLYPPQRPFADELTQRLAWVQALQKSARNRAARKEIQHFIPALPNAGDTTRMLELADMFRGEHTELAADDLDFSKVAEHLAEMGNKSETVRWQMMQKIQRTYLDTLDELKLWDKQTARLEAIKRKECHTDKQIVLIGTVDMNRTARRMLDLIADSVTALIIAPEELADHFDEHGCVVPQSWAGRQIPLVDDHVMLADDPIDQADEAVRALADWSHRRPDEITVGVCDERIVPQIARQFEQCDLNARWGPGRAISETAPYQLLRAVADYLERGRLREFAALVRHVDIEDWLGRSEAMQSLEFADWLTALDDYQSTHVSTRLTDQWLGEDDERRKAKIVTVEALYTVVTDLLSPLSGSALSLVEWTARVSQFLLNVYGKHEFHPDVEADRFSLAALEDLHAALLDQKRVDPSIAPKVTAADAIRWACEAVAGETVSAPADATAIEILGWLELPLDDAPALVATSLNEGHVPKSSQGDMFLPDSLRTRLGLDDNARRYARDAYALCVLVASRDARFIVGRRDADNNPLAPSRLLFACDDDTLVRRAKQFFTPPPPLAAKQPLAKALTPTRDKSTFAVPRPNSLKEPIEKLRVTAFRDYLACPYRFYLKQVMGLKVLGDDADELDGGAFGGLAHDVLNAFGRDPRRHTSNAEEIESLFEEVFQELSRSLFGTQPRPAVAVQLAQLQRRLQTLARVQAERAAEGWRIMYTEVPADDVVCEFRVDGKVFLLSGRIDRIDFHEPSGRWAIWDYKTSDTARKPAATHRRKDEWVDLQLPLYRHLASRVDGDLQSILEIEGKLQLGYVQLPKSVDAIRFEPAEWSHADLTTADDCAREVIRRIRREEFWPPVDPPPEYSEDFAGICLDGVFGRETITPSPSWRGPG